MPARHPIIPNVMGLRGLMNEAEKDWNNGDQYIMLPRHLFMGCTKEQTMNVKITIEED